VSYFGMYETVYCRRLALRQDSEIDGARASPARIRDIDRPPQWRPPGPTNIRRGAVQISITAQWRALGRHGAGEYTAG